MQARIWAQGLTVGIIMAAAGTHLLTLHAQTSSPLTTHYPPLFVGLTQLRGSDSVEVQADHVDHSWRTQVPELRREDAMAFHKAEQARQGVTTSA